MQVIDVENASALKNGRLLFGDVSFNVSKGSCHALIGRDNEGKTSVLNAIMGLSRLSAGNIVLFDEIIPQKLNKHMSEVGYVPDDLLTFEDMTGAHFLDMALGLRNKHDWFDYAKDLIDYFEVDPSMPLGYVPDWMNKCFYIISAIIEEPKLLILDEPFNYLNEVSRQRLTDWLKAYVKDGNTVLVTGNSYEDVRHICTHITTMKDRTTQVANVSTESFKPAKLVTVKNVDLKTIPDDFRVVFQNSSICKLYYSGNPEGLKNGIMSIKCDDFAVENVELEDKLLGKYEWMEEKL